MLRQEAEVQPQPANNEDRLNVDELLRYLAELQSKLNTQENKMDALVLALQLKNSELEARLGEMESSRAAMQQPIYYPQVA